MNLPCASSTEVNNSGDVQKWDGYAVPKLRNAGRMDFLGPFPTAILCVQLPRPFAALSQDQGFLVSCQPNTRVFHTEQGRAAFGDFLMLRKMHFLLVLKRVKQLVPAEIF